MSSDIQGVLQWSKARFVATDDTPLTNYRPAEFVKNMSINVHPYTVIALRAWGQAAAAKTASLRISGWMDQETGGSKHPGCGQVLWRGQLTTGAIDIDASPTQHGDWATGNWFEVSDWNHTVADGHNAVTASLVAGGGHSLLLLPTAGYSNLMFEVSDLGGGSEMSKIGLLYRPASLAEVA